MNAVVMLLSMFFHQHFGKADWSPGPKPAFAGGEEQVDAGGYLSIQVLVAWRPAAVPCGPCCLLT